MGQAKPYEFVSWEMIGGFNHLEKYEFVNGKDYPIDYGKNKKCLKPSTKWTIEYYRIIGVIETTV